MTTLHTVQELLAEEIRDLYSVGKQVIKALPKLTTRAVNTELKSALNTHLAETRQQIIRLEMIASLLGIKTSGRNCKGIEGVIAEGADALSMNGAPEVMDIDIASAANRVEHYEISGYEMASIWASEIGEKEVADLLDTSLEEQKEARKDFRKLASRLVAAIQERKVADDSARAKRDRKLVAVDA